MQINQIKISLNMLTFNVIYSVNLPAASTRIRLMDVNKNLLYFTKVYSFRIT